MEQKTLLTIIYKLLYDALFLALVSFFVLLVGEGLLPGFLSAHISMLRVFIILILIMVATIHLGRHLGIGYKANLRKKSALVPLLSGLLFLLIGNSMLSFALWQNFIITLSMLVVFFLLYKTLVSRND